MNGGYRATPAGGEYNSDEIRKMVVRYAAGALAVASQSMRTRAVVIC